MEKLAKLKAKALEGQDDRFLKATGLSDLSNVKAYFDSVQHERQEVLRDIFLTPEGKSILELYYTDPPTTGLAAQALEAVQLKFKLENLMDDFSDISPGEIDLEAVSFYVLTILKRIAPTTGGTPQAANRMILKLFKAGFFADSTHIDRFLAVTTSFNQEFARSGEELYGPLMLQMFLKRSIPDIVAKTQKSEDFLDTLEKYTNAYVFSEAKDFYKGFFGQEDPDAGFISHHVPLLNKLWTLTDGDAQMLERLLKLSRKAPDGKGALQSIIVLDDHVVSRLAPMLRYSNQFMKILKCVVDVQVIHCGEEGFDAFSGIELDLARLESDSPVLQRRRLYKNQPTAYENLTREFSAKYYGQVLRSLEAKHKAELATLYGMEGAHQESMHKLFYVYNKLLLAQREDVHPNPSEADVQAARSVATAPLEGRDPRRSASNEEWSRKMFRNRATDWLTSDEKTDIKVRGKRYTVRRATSVFDIAAMGDSVMGSCYRADGVNYWNIFPYLLDANKGVNYITDERGKVLARFLTAVDEEKNLIVFPLYYASDVRGLSKVQEEYIMALGRKYGLGHGRNVGHVKNINYSRWTYDQPLQEPHRARLRKLLNSIRVRRE